MTQFYIDGKWVELDELVDKAEKWDEQKREGNYTILCIDEFVDCKKKLEAVQKWCDYHAIPTTAGATRASLKKLFKIMESSDFVKRDDKDE